MKLPTVIFGIVENVDDVVAVAHHMRRRERRAIFRLIKGPRGHFWLTSKMSHERGRRGSCVSRRRDGRDRWLWRLVRPILHWEDGIALQIWT